MKSYLVGGSVRDELLGLPVQDRDYVVVGADPEEMVTHGLPPRRRGLPGVPASRDARGIRARAHRAQDRARLQGLRLPRRSPDVTLEDDLRRRDLTINAMARAEDGKLIDPHGGEQDLRAGLLRHVGEAFAEDPVRILRVARFAARFATSRSRPRRWRSWRAWSNAGEADALVPERVWQELARGLMEKTPSRMFEVLARMRGARARAAGGRRVVRSSRRARHARRAARSRGLTRLRIGRSLRAPRPRPGKPRRAEAGRARERAQRMPRRGACWPSMRASR